MLECSKHQDGTDSNSWRTANWPKYLHQLLVEFIVLDVVLKSNNGHLHQSAVIVREEVTSFCDLATAIDDIVQLFIQVHQSGVRQVHNHFSDAAIIAILYNITQCIEDRSLQTANNKVLVVKAVDTGTHAFFEHLVEWLAGEMRIFEASAEEVSYASHSANFDLRLRITNSLAEPIDEIVEVIARGREQLRTCRSKQAQSSCRLSANAAAIGSRAVQYPINDVFKPIGDVVRLRPFNDT